MMRSILISAFLCSTLLVVLCAAPKGACADNAAQLEKASLFLKYVIEDLKFSVEPATGEIEDIAGERDTVEGKVEALKMNETATEIKIELSGDILFDFDKASIRAAAEPTLSQVAEVIGRYRSPKVQIDGFTDSKGDDSYNLTLSRKRSDSVKAWLSTHGASGARMSTTGWGEAKPVAANSKPDGSDSPEGRQKNRRVEILVEKQ